MRPDRPKPRRSGPALIVSLVVHALVLAALLLSVRLPVAPPETPAVQVSLIDLSPRAPAPRPAPPTPRPVTPRPAPAPPADAPPPPPALRAAAAPPQPAAPSQPQTPQDYMSFFAERVVGCEREALILLSPADLERCRARMAAVEAMKPRSFRNAGGPDLGRLPGLVAEWRLALDKETARRERSRGAAGKAPTTACEGRGSNFGVGCLPAAE